MKDHIRRVARVAAVVAMVSMLAGCPRPTVKPEEEVTYLSATREQLMEHLVSNTSNLETLSAKARVLLLVYSARMPKSLADQKRRSLGKPFRWVIGRREVTGSFLLERTAKRPRKVKFYASSPNTRISLYMLGLGHDFWLKVPGVESRKGTEEAWFRGVYHDHKYRPAGELSIRPQDLADLLLLDDLIPAEGRMAGMEQWPEYYVINVLREGWDELLFSRIWIDRSDLRVSHHQLFTTAGDMIAEARFRKYRWYSFTANDGTKKRVELPTRLLLIWPRETLRLIVHLSNVKVNEPIDPKHFRPPDLSNKDVRMLGVVPEELELEF